MIISDVGHVYEWLVVVGAFGAFLFGFATGSNDVANAFGTSVGAKTLKLWQAVVIAAIFEFLGAILLGRVVTDTVASGIADINAFTRTPEIYAYGMVCALFVGGSWQLLASYLELNVSATHSIIGGIIGFSLVHAGKDGVTWAKKSTSNFPPYEGVVAIVIAWFASPILTGLAAALIFTILKYTILRRPNAYKLSFWTLPVAVAVTAWVSVFFMMKKGIVKLLNSEGQSMTDGKAAWIAAVCAGGLALLSIAAIPLIRHYIDSKYDEDGHPRVRTDTETGKVHTGDQIQEKDFVVPESPQEAAPKSRLQSIKKAALHGLTYDVHACVKEEEALGNLHSRAEAFPPKVEESFSWLQVFSACCVMFSHGAGEVGYAAGPLMVIYDNYKEGFLHKKREPPIWVLLIGATGLVIGLATYGYKVTRAMGVRLAKLSPTRGFSAELATALVIMIAAQYKLPTSSSQCITGGIIGVGICEGRKGVNWKQFGRQFAAWVLTLVIVGAGTAALFSQGVYAPSEIDSKAVITYEDRLVRLGQNIYSDLNSTLYSFRGPANAGDLPRLSPSEWASIQKTLSTSSQGVKNLTSWKFSSNKSIPDYGVQTVKPEVVLAAFTNALKLLQNYTINTLGQTAIFNGSTSCMSASSPSGGMCRAPNITV